MSPCLKGSTSSKGSFSFHGYVRIKTFRAKSPDVSIDTCSMMDIRHDRCSHFSTMGPHPTWQVSTATMAFDNIWLKWHEKGTRWAPTSYKLGYNPSYPVIRPFIRVISLLITGRGPPCLISFFCGYEPCGLRHLPSRSAPAESGVVQKLEDKRS